MSTLMQLTQVKVLLPQLNYANSIDVRVRPVVEPEDANNKLVVANESGSGDLSTIVADANGVIKFTTNSDNQTTDGSGTEIWDGEYVVRYQETDLGTVEEQVDEVIIQLTNTDGSVLADDVLSQLLVTGAVYEGGGRWVVTNEDAFSISAPRGLDFTPNDDTDDVTGDFNDIKMTLLYIGVRILAMLITKRLRKCNAQEK